MINVLYLSFSINSEYSGISKKKLAQVKGLKECGCNVVNCYYSIDPDNGHRLWMIDENVLFDLGRGVWAKIRKRIDYSPMLTYINEKQISLIYMRSEHNANPFLISFVKQVRSGDVKIVMEIPTFPYDQEYSFRGKVRRLFADKIFRRKLAEQLNALVTFSDQKKIFEQRTIQISNGIDFSNLRLKHENHKKQELHLIGVAEIHYWHGFDRIVAGMKDYYKSVSREWKVYLHIVGDFSGERERREIIPLIKENQLEKFVILHGKLFGLALDELFDLADIGIGSLARHRSNITHIKTLKNREYAARGIPFIYSETDEDFEEMPYIMKVPADDTPISIESLLYFYQENRWNPLEIRASVAHLSWKNQMQKVLDYLAIT